MSKISLIFLFGLISIGTNAQTVVETVSSGTSGDAILKIEADTDNNNESDNARIEIMQDGGGLGAYIGFNSDWGGVEADNLFRIGTRYSGIDSFNRFVIKGQNGNVGIGTSSPLTNLDVKGNSRASYSGSLYAQIEGNASGGVIKGVGGGGFLIRSYGTAYFNGGNVGVGTTSPNAKLQVNESGTIGGAWKPLNSFFTITDGSNSLIFDTNEIYGSGTLYFGSKSGDIVRFRTITESSASDKMIIKNNGNVGIGTTTPDSKLTVSGNIHAQEVKVTVNAGADFVFNDDYKLPSLKEVE